MRMRGITGSLSGRVLDKAKEPLPGATVAVLGTVKGAITDKDGKYSIVGIVAGEITVRVTMVGHDTVLQRVSLSADEARVLHFTLAESGGTLTGGVVVFGETEMISVDKIGTAHNVTGEQLTSIARPTVLGALGVLVPSLIVTPTGIGGRGGRPEESQMQVDNSLVSDIITGGFGNVGPTISSSMPSPYALQTVQARMGGFGAEYGGATAATVNAVAKTGSTEKFSALINWRKDVPMLFGKANNGVQAGAPLEDVVDITFDGPLGINHSTFSLAVRNTYQNHRNFGLQVLDPLGNNLGEMPNNRTWARNMLGRVKLELVKNVSLLIGGMYGTLSGERSSWDWLYANDQGTMVDPFGSPILESGKPQLNGVPERNAKQIVVQEFSTNLFAQITHALGGSTVYDLRVSYSGKTTETGKRKTFGAPGFFSGFDLWYPEDAQTITDFTMPDSGKVLRYTSGANRILDVYDYARASTVSEDGHVRLEVNQRNPLTGYVEGPADRASTNNPYGLINYFVARGNEGGIDFRNSRYVQFDGNITHIIETDSTDTTYRAANSIRHNIRAGFDVRLLRLSRHYNATPWAQDPFYDVFGSDYGGNLYFDVTNPQSLAAKIASEEPYGPLTGSLYVQDQITFQGLVFTPGVRLDYLDASSLYRTQLDPFTAFGGDSGFAQSKGKLYVSPRISIAYPISQGGRQNISLSYGIYYQAPPFADFFDSFNAFKLISGQALGNPNLEMQRTNQYQVAYNHQLSDELAFTVTGYYRDIYNQSSLAYVNILPNPYYQRVLSDYGSSRGLELTVQKRTTDHWGLNLNYALSSTKGTANDANTIPPLDPVTGRTAYPVTDFPLSFDRRHRVNGVVSFEWGNDCLLYTSPSPRD